MLFTKPEKKLHSQLLTLKKKQKKTLYIKDTNKTEDIFLNPKK